MLLSYISVAGSLHLLGIMLVSMLIGAGLMSLRQWCVGCRLRQFHLKYGEGYMTPDIDALLTKAHPVTPGGSGK